MSSAKKFRSQDRLLNSGTYPNLYYPNVFILNGGYKDFYALNKEYCYPQAYVEMDDASYRAECKHAMVKHTKQFRRSFSEGSFLK
jgi:M-phase inducer tyrosine phosphatase